jgi:hypothetical protein
MSTMKPMDRNSLEEQTRLVSRYVAGDLSRSERAEFEAWLVASPELAAEVEMERRLRRGISSAARRGWLNRKAPALRPPQRRWQMALAASVLLAVGAGLLLSLPQGEAGSEPSSRLASGEARPAGSPMVASLGKFRSGSGLPEIEYSRASAPSELIIEPDVVVLTCANGAVELECAEGGVPRIPQYTEYELDLVKRRGSTLAWRSARQQPAMRTQLRFALRDPGSRLDAGDYDVVVRGVSPEHEEVVGRFWMKVSP